MNLKFSNGKSVILYGVTLIPLFYFRFCERKLIALFHFARLRFGTNILYPFRNNIPIEFAKINKKIESHKLGNEKMHLVRKKHFITRYSFLNQGKKDE